MDAYFKAAMHDGSNPEWRSMKSRIMLQSDYEESWNEQYNTLTHDITGLKIVASPSIRKRTRDKRLNTEHVEKQTTQEKHVETNETDRQHDNDNTNSEHKKKEEEEGEQKEDEDVNDDNGDCEGEEDEEEEEEEEISLLAPTPAGVIATWARLRLKTSILRAVSNMDTEGRIGTLAHKIHESTDNNPVLEEQKSICSHALATMNTQNTSGKVLDSPALALHYLIDQYAWNQQTVAVTNAGRRLNTSKTMLDEKEGKEVSPSVPETKEEKKKKRRNNSWLHPPTLLAMLRLGNRNKSMAQDDAAATTGNAELKTLDGSPEEETDATSMIQAGA